MHFQPNVENARHCRGLKSAQAGPNVHTGPDRNRPSQSAGSPIVRHRRRLRNLSNVGHGRLGFPQIEPPAAHCDCHEGGALLSFASCCGLVSLRTSSRWGEREFDLLEAIGRDEEYGREHPSETIGRLLGAGLVQQSPFRGYTLTMRGQLVVRRGRMRQNRKETFLAGLARLGWRKPG